MDGLNGIIERNPTHPLFSATQFSTDSHPEGRQHLCQRATLGIKNYPKSNVDDANLTLRRNGAGFLPFDTYIGKETIARRTRFSKGFRATIPVEPYSRRAEKRFWSPP